MKFYLQVTKKLRTFALNLSVCTYAMQNYLFSVDCANHSPRFLFYIAILSTFLTTQRCTSNLNLGWKAIFVCRSSLGHLSLIGRWRVGGAEKGMVTNERMNVERMNVVRMKG